MRKQLSVFAVLVMMTFSANASIFSDGSPNEWYPECPDGCLCFFDNQTPNICPWGDPGPIFDEDDSSESNDNT